MTRLKVLLVAMGMAFAMGSTPVNAQSGGSYEIRAIAKLEQACSGGNAADCDELGMRHLRGDGTAKDPKKATSYFQRACDRGDARGCFNLGDSYQFGEGVPKDPAKAAAFYLRACDGREKKGCSELALSYLGGNGVERDEGKAALYADRACTLNSPLGCAILGMAYADGVEGYPQDLAEAKDLLSNACHQNVDYTKTPDDAARLACPALAKVTGEPACGPIEKAGTAGVRYCFDERGGAPAWMRTAATQDADNDFDPARVRAALDDIARQRATPAAPAPSPTATSATALNAGNAAYGRKDYASAAGLFAKACDAGSVEACGMLGEMYATGQGVAANENIAARMLAKACDQRVAKSCLALSALFESGSGVARDAGKALAFRERAKQIDPNLILPKNPEQHPALSANPSQESPNVRCPTYGKFIPASAQQVKLFIAAIEADSTSWSRSRYPRGSQYDAGSLSDVCVDYSGGPGESTLSAIYTYDGGNVGGVQLDLKNGRVVCIRYEVSCSRVRNAVFFSNGNEPSVTKNQSALVADALLRDSRSWLTKRLDVGSLTKLRVIMKDGEEYTIAGEFTFNNGINEGYIRAKIDSQKVQCISLAAYNSDFRNEPCNPVRNAPIGEAQDAYRKALNDRRSAWRACVNNYVLPDKHECGSEPSPGFDLGF